jgi:hypothetical protein
VLPCTPQDPHWQPRVCITGQGQIAAPQRLVGDLVPGLRVSAPMARIEDFYTKILCVLIAPSQHHRVGSYAATAGDAGNEWSMQPSLG